MLLEITLDNLDLVKEGINDSNKKKKNKHLAKAIAVITELNSSVSMTDKSDAANFLRYIYGVTLKKLTQVVQEDDTRTLQMIYDFLERMKEIWENTVIFTGCINLELEKNRWRM
jgi:flagellar protein FliS